MLPVVIGIVSPENHITDYKDKNGGGKKPLRCKILVKLFVGSITLGTLLH